MQETRHEIASEIRLSGSTIRRAFRATLCAVILTTMASHSQTVAVPKIFLEQRCERIVAVLDSLSGRFAARREDGATLLFCNEAVATSHFSVNIDGKIYTNYRWVRLNRDPRIVDLGPGTVSRVGDIMRCEWTVRAPHGPATIREELLAVRVGARDEVQFRLTVLNRGGVPLQSGLAAVFDVDAAGADDAPICIDGTPVAIETAFRGPSLPRQWSSGSPALGRDSIYGRLTGGGLVQPAAVIPGRYASHGYLGTAVHGYEAWPRKIFDSGIYLEWDEATLAAGDSLTASTALGIAAPPQGAHGPASRRFVLQLAGGWGGLEIWSDSLAHVTIDLSSDITTENAKSADHHWDTALTVLPNIPGSVLVFADMHGVKPPHPYQELMAAIEADKDIFVVHYSGNDGTIIYPPEQCDTSVVFPGVFMGGFTTLFSFDNPLRIGFHNFKSRWIISGAASDSAQWVSLDMGKVEYRSMQPRLGDFMYRYPNPPPDGTGLVGSSASPFGAYTEPMMPLVNSRKVVDSSSASFEMLPPSRYLGRRYIVVPFVRDWCPLAEPPVFVRIVAQRGGTRVSFDGVKAPRILDAGDYIDTLLARVTLLEASEDIAVYQHATAAAFIGGLLGSSACVALLPEERWGRTYRATHGFFHRHLSASEPATVWGIKRALTYPGIYRCSIVSRSREGISVDGTPLPGSNFTRSGEYWIAQLVETREHTIIRGGQPLYVVAYGWLGPIGYAYTPPWD